MLTGNKYILLLCFLFSLNLYAQQEILRNSRYEVTYDGSTRFISVEELASGKREQFTPTFVVLFKSTATTPKVISITEEVENIGYHTVGWDGEPNLFDAKAGNIRKRSVASCVKESANRLRFAYTNSGEFTIESTLTLPEGDAEPILEGSVTAQVQGYYSLGYYGAPEYLPSELDELWQPLVWTDKIFPKNKYLTPAHLCTLPGTMLRKNNVTSGVIADPSEFTFNLMPTMARSRFGVAIHNNQDKAQSMIFAPIIGSSYSGKMINETYSFKYRLFVSSKTISESYADLSQRLFGFGTHSRNNVLCSLNETFENMMEYCMDPYSKYDEDLKGYSYETDVTGSVRNTSALHALNLAFVTDDRTFYSKRAIPVIEFMLSREKDLFALNPTSGAGGQAAYNSLGNPTIRTSELAMLYKIGNSTNPFMLNLAKEKQQTSPVVTNLAHERTWKENMSLYNATGEVGYIQQANTGVAAYIQKRLMEKESEFLYTYHNKSSFWSALAPKWIELFELYETTGKTEYLDAAYEGALRFSRFLWMCPAIPNTNITVNQDNKAPVYGNQTKIPMTVPEETVPAWRLSEMGLHTEAAGTAASHRAVFMAHHAPYMLRIAALKNDTYLREIAKTAIIGRYRNFPGYHMNTDRTTVYEKVDFPLHTHNQITSTSMHYSHVTPMTSLIFDYLVSDAVARSNGEISFQSQFVEAFAYLQGKTYCGYGNFYGTDSVVLYMPKQLLSGGHQQLNYLIARKANNLYIAFSNQSPEAVQANYTINNALVNTSGSSVAHTFTNNVASADASISGNQLSVSVPQNGFVAVEIANAVTHNVLQDSMLKNNEIWQKDFIKMTDIPGSGMMLNFGKGNSSAYVFCSAPKDTYQSVKIQYQLDGGSIVELTDNAYPFEFSIPVLAETQKVGYKLVATSSTAKLESMAYTLEKTASLTMKMEGSQTIYPSENAIIRCSFSGNSPWKISYLQNGMLQTIENIVDNPLKISVGVTKNTLIEPVSVSNNETVGAVEGFAKIDIATDSIRPFYDGYVAESNKAINYSTGTQIELKNSTSWSREAYFSCNLSKFKSNDEKFVFRVYLNYIQPVKDIQVEIAGNEISYNTQLCWNNKDEHSFMAISQINVSGEDVDRYLEWDITSWIKSQLQQGKIIATFRLRILNSGEALCKLYATEASGNVKPGILAVNSTIINGLVTSTDEEAKLYPNPAKDYVMLETTSPCKRIEIWSVDGRLIHSTNVNPDEKVKMAVSSLSNGIYFIRALYETHQSSYKFIKTN